MKICIKYEQLKLGDEHDYECDCSVVITTHIVVAILNYAVYIRVLDAHCMGKNVPLRLLRHFGINFWSKGDRKITSEKRWRCTHQ